MARSITQGLPAALPMAGLPGHEVPAGNLGLTNRGLQSSTFTAQGNCAYLVPAGGTVTLPTPTGSGAFISLAIFGSGLTTLSGTMSVAGVVFTSYQEPGGQTLLLCDADKTQGWC